jgi:hypothetical protein
MDASCCSRQQPLFEFDAGAGSGLGVLRSLGAGRWQGAVGCSAPTDPESVAVNGSKHRARHAVGAAKAQIPSRVIRVRFMINSASSMPNLGRYRQDASAARGPAGARWLRQPDRSTLPRHAPYGLRSPPFWPGPKSGSTATDEIGRKARRSLRVQRDPMCRINQNIANPTQPSVARRSAR